MLHILLALSLLFLSSLVAAHKDSKQRILPGKLIAGNMWKLDNRYSCIMACVWI